MAAKNPSEAESQLLTEDHLSVQSQAEIVNNLELDVLSVLRQAFRDFHFPATKSQIMKYLRFDGNNEIASKLHNIEDKQYSDESEIARAAGLIL
ncbi:MAG TPA: hypothetical protein VH500_17655 [Nitrososphaeraceae archaeon]|jgi:hypothetical protein